MAVMYIKDGTSYFDVYVYAFTASLVAINECFKEPCMGPQSEFGFNAYIFNTKGAGLL